MPWRPRRFAVRMDREGQTKPLRPSQKEIDRRYANIRAAMAANNIDALIVCGNQYAGFEGAIRYVSGFEIVHRYVYVLLPLSGEPTLLFPREARWIGDKKAPWVRDQVWAEIPGKWLREKMEARGRLWFGLHHGCPRLPRASARLRRTRSFRLSFRHGARGEERGRACRR